MFNDCRNIFCNSGNLYYNKALRIYSSFIFFRVIFICVAYLFSLTVCLMSSSSMLLRAKFRISYTYLNTILYFSITLIYVNHFWLYNIFMKLCGDVEENPGPKPNSNQIFSICHWNLNSISTHNHIKLSLLRAYLYTHRFDAICLSETYLNSETSHEDPNLEIVDYTLIRDDHPSNSKACLYYRNSLAFGLLNIQYFEECINFEISFAGKACNFISLYRSPNQSHNIFETFVDNLELNLKGTANKNPYLIIILGDFNAKSSNWYKQDKTTYEGSKIEAINNISVWTNIVNSGTNTYVIKLVFLYWSSIYVSTQPCNGIRSTFFATWKLSSPTSICKI